MKKRLLKRTGCLSIALIMLLSTFFGATSVLAAEGDGYPTKEQVEQQLVDFRTTTYTVQIGTFSDWNYALERYILAKEQGWNPYMRYEKIGNTWYYKVWTLDTPDYAAAKAEYDKIMAKNVLPDEQVRIYEYLCPYVEVVYKNYKGEEMSFEVEVRGNSYLENDAGIYNETTVINSVDIMTNSGSQYVGEFFRYDVLYPTTTPNYKFELIYPERFKMEKDPDVTQTVTNRNEKWVFYLTDDTSITTTIEGTKTWNDDDNLHGRRPETITINLLTNNQVVDNQTVTADENGEWKFKFENLPVYVGGEIANYTVSEEAVKYYTTEVEGTNITNTYDRSQETVDVRGKKLWNDVGNESARPESITVKLWANGEPVESKTVTADDGWAYSFGEMPKYDAEGEEITYTVSEESVTNYTTVVNGYDITNTYVEPQPEPEPEPETVTIEGQKYWNDVGNESARPDRITVKLLADGEQVKSKTVTADDGWAYSFGEMPKYDAEGEEITYTVSEESVTNYTTVVNGYDITNTYVEPQPEPVPEPTPEPKPETVTVEGQKYWNDAGNESARPESITVKLWANGEQVGSKTVTVEDDWAYSFGEMPKYDAEGEEITYTVSEESVANYTTVVNGYDITNTYVQPQPEPVPEPTPEPEPEPEPQPEPEPEPNENEEIPKTGNNSIMVYLAMVTAILSGIALIVLARKKKHNV